MESKSAHRRGSCFYIFRTDARTWSKVPQFQNQFSPLLWIATTISPPWFFKTRHWKIQKTKSVNWYSFGCSWFFFLKGQWTTLPEEALSLDTWELTSTKGLLNKNRRQRWKNCIMAFFLNTHVNLSSNFFFLLKIKCTSLGLQRFTQTQLRSSYWLS